MKHINDGTIRRLIDDPNGVSANDAAHLDRCGRCGARRESIAHDALVAARVLAGGPLPVGTAAALAVVRGANAGTTERRPAALDRLRAAMKINPRRTLAPLAGISGAVALSAALVITGTAQNLFSVFEPTHVVAVHLSPASFSGIPDLSAYGTMKTIQAPTFSTAPDLASAMTASHLHLLSTGPLPGDLKGRVVYRVMSQGRASFTFSAAAAQAAADRSGKALPPLPAGLDGSSLLISLGPAVIETVGEPAAPAADRAAAAGSGSMAGAGGSGAEGMSTKSDSASHLLGALGGLPKLAILQMGVPSVSSTGASVKQLEDALLSMPGISPDLAAAVRALGDPVGTLPIPVPTGASSSNVKVDGTTGVVVGDNTGIGSAIVWVKGGMVYAVAGSLPQGEVVAIARSMR